MSQQQPQGILQDIRSFVAQIRDMRDTIVGTGFVVQRDPVLIVTCKHVVEEACGVCEKDAELQVYFTQIKHGETEDKTFTAKVSRLLDRYDDDIAVLQLTADKFLPTEVETAVLGTTQGEDHEFRSYGYRVIDKYQGNRAIGMILGHVDKPPQWVLHSEPVQLQSQHLDRGMSGAPVLDRMTNLVVGIVSETWDSDRRHVDRDTGYGVDCAVLSLDALGLPLHDKPTLDLTQSPPPSEQAQANAKQVATQLPRTYPLAPEYRPPDLPEWVGRTELLDQLTRDMHDDSIHVSTLIGFGGEGKTSLAYRWLTEYALNSTPDAVFWWSFYESRSVDEMIEQLTAYLYSEDLLERVRGVSTRVENIGAFATKERRVLLVLDGMEVMQEESGDDFGAIRSPDLKRLLELFAQADHQSHCVVTSRVPLLDFLSHTAVTQHDVNRLTPADGRQLLRNLDVAGDERDYDRIIEDWEGHALTVSLVGTYLREQGMSASEYVQDIFDEVEQFEDEVPRYQRVRRVLTRYDKSLSNAQKAFLKLFAVFRLPVSESAFGRVFRADTGSGLNAELVALDDDGFNALVEGLIARRLLKRTQGADDTTYSAHPLVQRHYRHALEQGHSATDAQPIHRAVAEHYKETTPRPTRDVTLDDLKPYIEVVHHLCRAGAYDEAVNLVWQRILQGDSRVLHHKLGAYETYLSIMLEFFSDGDKTQEPQVSADSAKRFILNAIGLCLMSLGRLRDAVPFYERGNAMDADLDDHHNASIGYNNLADLYTKVGDLQKAQTAAEQALAQAQQVADETQRKGDERNSYLWLAWTQHLRGAMATASANFKQAEALETEIDPAKKYLYSLRGIRHADHLIRAGDSDYAQRITEANLKSCADYNWLNSLSRVYRVLGDLAGLAGEADTARTHYDEALRISNLIDRVDVQIEALLGRGRWLARHQRDAQSAFTDLDTALALATKGGYGIYEADIRVALAWAHLAKDDTASAGREAGQAMALSSGMGYHWGQVDAQEVFAEIGQHGGA